MLLTRITKRLDSNIAKGQSINFCQYASTKYITIALIMSFQLIPSSSLMAFCFYLVNRNVIVNNYNELSIIKAYDLFFSPSDPFFDHHVRNRIDSTYNFAFKGCTLNIISYASSWLCLLKT